MKALRPTELRALSREELMQKQQALMQELLQMRLKAKTVGVEKPSRSGVLRRNVARIITILREST